MSVAILVPVLWRPANVAPLVDSLCASTPEPHSLLFIAEPADFEEIEAIEAAGCDHISPGPRAYARKINAGARATEDEWLFLAADDIRFHPGWLSAALEKAEPGVDVIGTDDGGCNPRVTAGIHSVHSFVRRSYVEEEGASADGPGVVLHEGYRHVFCDDELVGLARARGVYAHASRSVVEHLHPYAAKAPMDVTYRKGQVPIRHDTKLFERRRLLWET